MTVKPTLGPSFLVPAAFKQNAAKNGQEKREPSSYTLRKSLRRRIRTAFGNGTGTMAEFA